eukprot:3870255-Prymnesium_polylepis.1
MLVLSLSACAYQLHVVPSARRTVRQAAHAARMAAAAIDEQQARCGATPASACAFSSAVQP